MIKLIKDRSTTIPFTFDNESAKVTFKFKNSLDYEKAISELENPEEVTYLTHDLMIDAISGVEEMKMDDGSEVDVTDLEVRKSIFELFKNDSEAYVKCLTAFMGPRAKNLKAGVMEQLMEGGDQATVDHAS